MSGEFVGVWSETWEDIWLPLAESEAAPPDLFCELYRELATAFAKPLSIEAMADVIDDREQSWKAFERASDAEFASETVLVRFFEAAHEILYDLKGDELANHYYVLLTDFIEKYNLGYSLRRPCALSPTLSGIFADLTRSLKSLANTDEHLAGLFHAHEEAVRDLRFGATEERIKTCISRQFMVLEAIASTADGVKANTLGDMCNQLTYWPHATIKASLKSLYGFASDYPGIRHAGNPSGRLRSIEPRDFVALSILLIGYSPYLTSALDIKLKLASLEQ